MPANNLSIRRSLEALRGGQLSQDALERLARDFDDLAQDRPETLVFFVLHHVCRRLVSAIDGEAVSVERFGELTADLAELMAAVLGRVERGERVGEGELDGVVGTLFRNLALFRSGGA